MSKVATTLTNGTHVVQRRKWHIWDDCGMRDRIRQRLHVLDMSANLASAACGDRGWLGKFLRNRRQAICTDMLHLLAGVLQCTPEWLLKGSAPASGISTLDRTGRVMRRESICEVPIMGLLESEAFRNLDAFRDKDLGKAGTTDAMAKFAFIVADNAMNGRHITDGDKVICAGIAEYPLGTGDIVVVERVSLYGKRELSLKEVEISTRAVALRPRSSELGYASIVLPAGADLRKQHTYHGHTIKVLGVVIESVRRHSPPMRKRLGRTIVSVIVAIAPVSIENAHQWQISHGEADLIQTDASVKVFNLG